jgi:hypothetical protein
MHYILVIVILLFPMLGYSETLATCSTQTDHSYFANMGFVKIQDSGWKVSPETDTISLSKLSENNFDILYVDATKAISSVTEEGAQVKLLRNSKNEMAFLVSSPGNTTIEIYDFLRDNQGKNILIIVTSRGGNPFFYRGSVENGECSFINFSK